MTDRIEALARQIDPEAWRRVKCVVPVKASIGLAASGMSMQEIGAFHLREAQLRDSACRESLRAARIAIGLEIVLAGRLTQHDDGK